MQHGRRGGWRKGEAAAAGERGGGLVLPDHTLRHGERMAQAADRAGDQRQAVVDAALTRGWAGRAVVVGGG
ncbi:Os03g0711650 [Oryza sativa Japonica Group]|nr:hypothetical protein EE612_019998 [Oryza sativa]BAS86033.1 Os03g0711650 [Oryza sativa Japonica Group]